MISSATFVVVSLHFKIKCPLRIKQQQGAMDSSRSSAKDNRTTHAGSTNDTVEAGEIPCGAQTAKKSPIVTPTAAPGGTNELTATLTLLQPGPSRTKGICNAFNIPEQDD